MHFHFLQHVHFEGPAGIADWITQNGHSFSITYLYKNECLPTQKQTDILIIMGGPMAVTDTEEYPWLIAEQHYLHEAIQTKRSIIGICLGAQLIASVLGAKVIKNEHREIGWHMLTRTSEIEDTILGDLFPKKIDAFHWHGETFTLPEKSIRLASSEACENQGFIIDNRIIGFQFHLETTVESATALIQNCGNEINNSKYVQSKEQMLSETTKFKKINTVMNAILAKLVESKAFI